MISQFAPLSRRAATLLAATAAAVLIVGGSAQASTPAKGDSVTIALGKSGGALLAKGVKASAIAPAKLGKKKLVLPVSDITTPGITNGQLVLSGGLKLSSGKKSVKIQGLLVLVKGTKVSISAKVGTSRVTLLSGTRTTGGVDATTGSVAFGAESLSLSKGAAGAIRKALSVAKIRAGALGTASGKSTITITSSGGSGSTTPSGNTPKSDYGFPSQTELTRPGTATDVTSASNLVFWPRDSYINYNANGGGLTTAVAPATNGPAIDQYAQHACPFNGPDGARSYSFNMPFVSGWWDTASATGVLRYSGAVRFTYPDHGIDQLFADPIVEFNGTSSRVLFVISDDTNSARVDLMTIPGVSAPAPTFTTYNGKSTDHGNAVLGGFYPKGVAWGCVQLNFST